MRVNGIYFTDSSTATATATVAPTMGLLPMASSVFQAFPRFTVQFPKPLSHNGFSTWLLSTRFCSIPRFSARFQKNVDNMWTRKVPHPGRFSFIFSKALTFLRKKPTLNTQYSERGPHRGNNRCRLCRSAERTCHRNVVHLPRLRLPCCHRKTLRLWILSRTPGEKHPFAEKAALCGCPSAGYSPCSFFRRLRYFGR